MVDCPSILRKPSFAKATKGKEGISITELLIVVAVLAVLMIVFLAAFKPWTQQAKARDARRKSDLQKLKNPLEDYYNDNNCYPEALPTLVSDYLGELPKDPDTGEEYEYAWDENCEWYRIYTTLEFTADPEIVEVGCGAGCGPEGDDGTCEYNYGVSGGSVGLECCTLPGARCPDGYYEGVPTCEQPRTYCPPPYQAACCSLTGMIYCSELEEWCCIPGGE